ncbi:hypothetical protein [Brenneria uluponensis]|uniref:hypothetical protein n=1 Tax=Brenneria uluponensis TaxID=3057057 RepID=UPI003CCC85C9
MGRLLILYVKAAHLFGIIRRIEECGAVSVALLVRQLLCESYRHTHAGEFGYRNLQIRMTATALNRARTYGL